MSRRITVTSSAPFGLTVIVCLLIVVNNLIKGSARGGTDSMGQCIYAAIFIFFLMLPSTSRYIFLARQCESFGYDDEKGISRSYLLADLDVRCSTEDPDYKELELIFWFFFLLWPVLVPMVYLGLILRIRRAVVNNRITKLANACKFLWADYVPSSLFWEVIDVERKVLLSAVILFVDTEFGSTRMLRLALAAIISAMYLSILAVARPFKRLDDMYLACLANLLLTCSFVSGFAVKLCEAGQWDDSCRSFLGLSGPYETTFFVVILTSTMLVASLAIIVINILTAATAPTIRVASTGFEPKLDLSTDLEFHCFLSHAWGTGQDQTHTVARQLQLLMPDAKIWLDVDNLDDVGKLEQSVRDSAVFIIFLSKGYFNSANCRRELYTALAASKPIVVIQEADEAKGGADIEAFMAECRKACVETAPPAYPEYRGPTEVLERLFSEGPVIWVRVHDFQIESLKLIALRMCTKLPYYLRNPDELLMGLKVPGEIGPMGFRTPVQLLVCSDNDGAWPVAKEVMAASVEDPSAVSISIHDAESVLGQIGADQVDQTALLLYLNTNIFQDRNGKVSTLVHRAMDLKITLALIHEQDVSKGGCPFRIFFDQTPKTLLMPPYKLFDTVAVPLYPAPEHRRISLRHLLRGMKAKPLSVSQSVWDCLPWRCAGGNRRNTVTPADDGSTDAIPEAGGASEEVQSNAGQETGSVADHAAQGQLPQPFEDPGESANNVHPPQRRPRLSPTARPRLDVVAGATTEPSCSPMVDDGSSLRNQDAEAGPREELSIYHVGWGDKEPQGYLKVQAMQVILSSH